MQPLTLTLKGFRGIRDGLALDALTLDFERLADGGALVAIVGANGRGKTTILDNMHPFLTMPSRAAVAGPGGFSYYDHVFLPESVKDLLWAHADRSYRSQIVIRLAGRRRTEAYLHQLSDEGRWMPVALPDGSISDGKVETYGRCVEHLCGSADTFFTSVFSSQGKRQLSAYRNAEIKTLLADLLGQDSIRELGQQALETARLIKAGLQVARQEAAAIDSDAARLTAERQGLEGGPDRVEAAAASRASAQAAVEGLHAEHARLLALKEQGLETKAQRERLNQERQAAQRVASSAAESLDARERVEAQRLQRLEGRVAQEAARMRERYQALLAQRQRCIAVLALEAVVRHAASRASLAERVRSLREDRLQAARDAAALLASARQSVQLLVQRLDGIDREAGRAAMSAADLARRFGLTERVPCRGTGLQDRCDLLGDAHEARALLPNAQAVVQRLAEQRIAVQQEVAQAQARIDPLGPAEAMAREAQRRVERSRERAARLATLAVRADEMARARATLVEVDAEIGASAAPALESTTPVPETSEVVQERAAIAAALQAIAAQRAEHSTQLRDAAERIDAALAALPAPFDGHRLEAVIAARARAAAALTSAEGAQLQAVRDAEALAALTQRQASLIERRADAAAHVGRIERALGDWNLLARCLSNDGLIALAIDDAGPALAGLANDLLLACYGPRFTVAILTQVETAKGEQKEGFDVMVHDAESGQSKSVSLMSGGERVWINECLVRAVAVYLSQNTGRRYDTLFSDEADGALDPERKRMFMAMKREVLRLGGYRQEFFISQTPELAAMADAVIDLETFVGRAGAPADADSKREVVHMVNG